MDLELDLSEFCCLNKDCPDYGKNGKENIRVKERYGSKNLFSDLSGKKIVSSGMRLL